MVDPQRGNCTPGSSDIKPISPPPKTQDIQENNYLKIIDECLDWAKNLKFFSSLGELKAYLTDYEALLKEKTKDPQKQTLLRRTEKIIQNTLKSCHQSLLDSAEPNPSLEGSDSTIAIPFILEQLEAYYFNEGFIDPSQNKESKTFTDIDRNEIKQLMQALNIAGSLANLKFQLTRSKGPNINEKKEIFKFSTNFLVELISNLRKGESILIPSSGEGHGIVFEIKKRDDHSFDFLLINTIQKGYQDPHSQAKMGLQILDIEKKVLYNPDLIQELLFPTLTLWLQRIDDLILKIKNSGTTHIWGTISRDFQNIKNS